MPETYPEPLDSIMSRQDADCKVFLGGSAEAPLCHPRGDRCQALSVQARTGRAGPVRAVLTHRAGAGTMQW